MKQATGQSSKPGECQPLERRTRSRFGCARCKQRRQRCDLQKPHCGRCITAGNDCRYEINLRWGGRPFPKSSFGRQSKNVEKSRDTTDRGGGFVYSLHIPLNGIAEPSPESLKTYDSSDAALSQLAPSEETRASKEATLNPGLPPDAVLLHQEDPISDTHEFLETVGDIDCARFPLSRPLEPLPSLPPVARLLLKHYVQETVHLTSPSTYARSEICRFIVPMSLQRPCLLFAVLAFAAVHLETIGGLPGIGESLITNLQEQSYRHLRHQLNKCDSSEQPMALATARTLCQVQILRGEKTWRTHLDGARAIIQSAHSQEKVATEKMQIYEKSFLSSWYNNAEALAALTPSGLLRGQLEADGVTNPSMPYFDVFGGVASDIPSLLREIGALVEERRRSKSKRRGYESLLSERDIIKEAEALMVQIYHRLEEDATGGLFFDSHLLSVLSPDDIQDYSMSNASFLHTALLYLQCGVLRLPSSDPGVQGSVYGIITCAESMTPSLGSSPRVLLGTPLFTAGLCATGPARERIRSAFEDIGKWLRTPHISKAIQILEDLWSRFSDESKGDVWSYIEKKNPDFLAY